MRSRTVQPEWATNLSIQQQSVLFLAARGPDGVDKFHRCKDLVRAYRCCVLNAASMARPLVLGDTGDTFMDPQYIWNPDPAGWNQIVDNYFWSVDSLPHHYHLHLAHGAEILGYKHPYPLISNRWLGFYLRAVEDMHMAEETEKEMDERLNDFGGFTA